MGNGEAKLRNPRGVSKGCTDSVQSGETHVVSIVAKVVRRLMNRLLHNSVDIEEILGVNLSVGGTRRRNEQPGLEVTVRTAGQSGSMRPPAQFHPGND